MTTSPQSTPALRALETAGVAFEVVRTERAGSVEESARLQGIEVGDLIKTIVVRRGEGDYLFVLVPGDRAIDWAKLRALLAVSRLSLPDAEEAKDATGYERGAITPFGSVNPWPVIAPAGLEGRGKVAIGGGAHGVNVHMDGATLVSHLGARTAEITKPR